MTHLEGKNDSTVGRVFTLHVANVGSIPATHIKPPAIPGVIPECRTKSGISASPGVTPKYKKDKIPT